MLPHWMTLVQFLSLPNRLICLQCPVMVLLKAHKLLVSDLPFGQHFYLALSVRSHDFYADIQTPPPLLSIFKYQSYYRDPASHSWMKAHKLKLHPYTSELQASLTHPLLFIHPLFSLCSFPLIWYKTFMIASHPTRPNVLNSNAYTVTPTLEGQGPALFVLQHLNTPTEHGN